MTPTSRYFGLPVLPAGGNNLRPEYAPRSLANAGDLVRRGLTWERQVHAGERIDQIAFEALGDSRLWWLITDLNPDIDPLFLDPTVRLIMPRLELAQ